MAVVDTVLSTLFEIENAKNLVKFGQLVKQQLDQIDQYKEMIDRAAEQSQRMMQNLASAGDIKSWDDFMGWYNRQLYLEKQTVETFGNMKVTIGKKQYGLAEIEQMVQGFKEKYIDYWNDSS